MSYQVLARKWRPKNFEELQGQEHVSRALINAIETERLHHAYLFTGTRGVGKTTIARILSKCLNCETNGLTANPCGECSSCVEIDEGRFVDLIEVDAASRTKVDDTRELLDNVQYRPTRGRYKVYLIDEVHMLSNSSFNALLKTLEEPPEHVVFLLATTDPQKLPVTVLSRCLQFHLKHMDEETISQHLNFILSQESIQFESMALSLIAQSAEGSMRDALSLLDQAIAFGQGQVNESDIRTMLGTIDHQFIEKLLESLELKDSKMAIETISEMSNYPVDFADALKELLSRIHQTAIFQATGVLLDSAASYVERFAESISTQDLQMYYQLGLHARRDLVWAATPKQGLEMALLRMLAFKIDNAVGPTVKKKPEIKEIPTKGAPQIEPVVETQKKTDGHEKVRHLSDETNKSQAVSLTEQPKAEQFSHDYSDYHWGEEAPEQESQDDPETAEIVKSKANQVSAAEPDKETTIEAAPSSNLNRDPVASLHAALGLTQTTEALETSSRKAPKQSVQSFNKSIEDELEETTKKPQSLQAPETEGQEADDEIESDFAGSLMNNLLNSNSDTPLPEILAPQNEIQKMEKLEVPLYDIASTDDEWANLVVKLGLVGTLEQIVYASLLDWIAEDKASLKVNPRMDLICTDSAKAGIEEALIKHFERRIHFEWSFEEGDRETPAMIFERLAKDKHRKACETLIAHPFSQELIENFDAQLKTDSVEYLH